MTGLELVLLALCALLGTMHGPWGELTEPTLFCVSVGVAAGALCANGVTL